VAKLTLLTYAYVEGMAERRAPHRRAHLALVQRWKERGELLLAGASGSPPTGAILVFDAPPERVERFAAADPYGAAGLIVERRIEPLNVVAHAPLPEY
jgi:uncharacterized protein